MEEATLKDLAFTSRSSREPDEVSNFIYQINLTHQYYLKRKSSLKSNSHGILGFTPSFSNLFGKSS